MASSKQGRPDRLKDRVIQVCDKRKQGLSPLRALRGDDPDFRQMATQSVKKLGALSHEKLAQLMMNERGLIFDRPHRHKPHRRPSDCFANCRRISRIVFLTPDVGLHIGRRHQAGVMAEFDQFARLIMGRTTGFQLDNAPCRKAPGCPGLVKYVLLLP